MTKKCEGVKSFEIKLFSHFGCTVVSYSLTRIAPNVTIAEFANTVDPDETAHDESSHLDLQCLPVSLSFFNIVQCILKVCRQ